mgnify:CR=1 FL=1
MPQGKGTYGSKVGRPSSKAVKLPSPGGKGTKDTGFKIESKGNKAVKLPSPTKKSKGYKMKGFSGFGNSPAKVSDSDILKLQGQLNKAELDFKEPGWAKVAGKLHDPLGIMGGDSKGGSDKVSQTASDAKGVADTAKTIGSLFGGGAA